MHAYDRGQQGTHHSLLLFCAHSDNDIACPACPPPQAMVSKVRRSHRDLLPVRLVPAALALYQV